MTSLFDWGSLFAAGGPILLILLVALLVSLIIMVERWFYFRSIRSDADALLLKITSGLQKGESPGSLLEAGDRQDPVGYVLSESLASLSSGGELRDSLYEEVKSRAIAEKIPELERYLNIEATLGTVSPFIGLLGTVLGIIRAFQSLGLGSVGGETLSGLNAGIAEALVTTAAGLFVAIPSTMAFNFFRKRVEATVLRMEIAASRLKVMVLERSKER